MDILFQILHFLCLLSAIACLQLKPSLNINTPLDILLNNINVNNNKLDKSKFQKQCYCIQKNANSPSVSSLIAPNNDNLERLVLYLYKNNGVIQVYIPNKYKQGLIPELNFDKHQGDILKPASSESIVNIFDSSLNLIISPKPTVPIVEEIIRESETNGFVSTKPNGYNSNDNKESNNDKVYLTPIEPGVNAAIKGNKPFDEQNVSINIAIKPSRQTPGDTINIPGLASNDANLLQIPPISTSGPQGATQIKEFKNPITGQVTVNGQIISNIVNSNQLHSSLKINNVHPRFNEWFDYQLARVVLYNVETPEKLLELRHNIKLILRNNGMVVDSNGYVRDSRGFLVRMNTIKFRPILIGNQVDQSIVYQRTQSVVPYIQVIEIIRTTPPSTLGTLALGIVYLPRNVNLHKLYPLNKHRFAYVIRNGRRQYGGCTTCNVPPFSRRYPYPNSIDDENYALVTGRYAKGQPYVVHSRRNFETDEQNLTEKSTLEEAEEDIEEPAAEESRQEDSGDVSRSGSLGGVVDGLLGNFGMTPTFISEPSRRLLGGVIPSNPAPGPRGYPNDVLPGFRIIGGNPATSSGTPLVSKGRSGFEKPSLII